MRMLSKSVTIPFIIYLLWLGWTQLGPQVPEMGPLRRVLADQAIVAIAEDLRQNSKSARTAILLHFEHDPTNYVTNNLRRIVEQRGVFDLEGPSFMDRLRETLNLRPPSVSSISKAAESARSTGVNAAIMGQIKEFESYPGGAKAQINYALVGADGTTIYQGQFQKTISDAVAAPAALVSKASPQLGDWSKGVMTWLILVLLLPVFTIAFIRAMVRRKSNTSNAFVLVIYTSIGVIAAYLLIGQTASGTWLGFQLLAAGVLALAYNIKITSLAVRLEE